MGYICPVCSQDFNKKEEWKNHCQEKHNGEALRIIALIETCIYYKIYNIKDIIQFARKGYL